MTTTALPLMTTTTMRRTATTTRMMARATARRNYFDWKERNCALNMLYCDSVSAENDGTGEPLCGEFTFYARKIFILCATYRHRNHGHTTFMCLAVILPTSGQILHNIYAIYSGKCGSFPHVTHTRENNAHSVQPCAAIRMPGSGCQPAGDVHVIAPAGLRGAISILSETHHTYIAYIGTAQCCVSTSHTKVMAHEIK